MFGLDLFDAALMPSLAVALLAGILSFLSPCVLPIVPPYLAYMGGISMSEMTGRIAARLDALPLSQRQLLDNASVIGASGPLVSCRMSSPPPSISSN